MAERRSTSGTPSTSGRVGPAGEVLQLADLEPLLALGRKRSSRFGSSLRRSVKGTKVHSLVSSAELERILSMASLEIVTVIASPPFKLKSHAARVFRQLAEDELARRQAEFHQQA